MQIKCKRCNSAISADNINLEKSIAKCGACDSVFDFSPQVEQQETGKRTFSEPPEGVEVSSTKEGIVFERRWINHSVWFPVLFCIGLNAFMWVRLTMAIVHQDYTMAAFGGLQAVICLVASYFIVGLFINKTWTSITATRLGIQHGPMPWLGNREIPSHEIAQVFVQQREISTKHGTSLRYDVLYLDTQGKEGKLMSRLLNPDHALYLEQEIESILGIQDRAVPGDFQ